MACTNEQAAFDAANQAALDAYTAADLAVNAVAAIDVDISNAQIALMNAQTELTTAQDAKAVAVQAATVATQDADAAEQDAAATYTSLQTCLRNGAPYPASAAFFNRTRRRV